MTTQKADGGPAAAGVALAAGVYTTQAAAIMMPAYAAISIAVLLLNTRRFVPA